MEDDDHEDQARCMTLAGPLLADFHDAWHVALGRYLSYPAEFTAEHDDTTAANCIRAHMWTEIVRRFVGRRGCKLLHLTGLNLLNHRDETVWRFKQVDGSGRHQNYQTPQQRRYDLQLTLPGLPLEAVRLTSGYQPDAALQSIQRIIVSRPFAKVIRWSSQIHLDGATASWESLYTDHLQDRGFKSSDTSFFRSLIRSSFINQARHLYYYPPFPNYHPK